MTAPTGEPSEKARSVMKRLIVKPMPGDAVGVLGTPEQRAAFRTIAGAFDGDRPGAAQGVPDR